MFACASPDEPEPGFCLGEPKPMPEKKKPRRGRSRERPKARRKESAADEAPPRIDVKIDAAVPPAAVGGDDPKRSLGRKNVSERLLRVGAAVKEKLVHLAENLEAAPKHVALSASELIEEGGGGAETSRPLLRLDESQVEFPKLLRRACEFPIVDPRHTLEWDVLMLVLITYVMTVTPFELAFVRAPSVREVIYQQRPKYVWMFLRLLDDAFRAIDRGDDWTVPGAAAAPAPRRNVLGRSAHARSRAGADDAAAPAGAELLPYAAPRAVAAAFAPTCGNGRQNCAF